MKVCVVLDFGAPYASSLEYKKSQILFSKIIHPEERVSVYYCFYDAGFERNRTIYIWKYKIF